MAQNSQGNDASGPQAAPYLDGQGSNQSHSMKMDDPYESTPGQPAQHPSALQVATADLPPDFSADTFSLDNWLDWGDHPAQESAGAWNPQAGPVGQTFAGENSPDHAGPARNGIDHAGVDPAGTHIKREYVTIPRANTSMAYVAPELLSNSSASSSTDSSESKYGSGGSAGGISIGGNTDPSCVSARNPGISAAGELLMPGAPRKVRHRSSRRGLRHSKTIDTPRRVDSRRAESRRAESRRNDSRRNESRRLDPRRSDQCRLRGLRMANRSNSVVSSSTSSDASTGSTLASSVQSSVGKPKRDRSSHNIIEKKYRTNINSKIAKLRNVVPALQGFDGNGNMRGQLNMSQLEGLAPPSRLNKASVLEKATEYIQHLQTKNDALDSEVRALRAFIQRAGLAVPAGIAQSRIPTQPAAQFINYGHDPRANCPVPIPDAPANAKPLRAASSGAPLRVVDQTPMVRAQPQTAQPAQSNSAQPQLAQPQLAQPQLAQPQPAQSSKDAPPVLPTQPVSAPAPSDLSPIPGTLATPVGGQMFVGGIAAMLGSQFLHSSAPASKPYRSLSLFPSITTVAGLVASVRVLTSTALYFIGLYMVLQPMCAAIFRTTDGIHEFQTLHRNRRRCGSIWRGLFSQLLESSPMLYLLIALKYLAVNCGIFVRDGTDPAVLARFNWWCDTMSRNVRRPKFRCLLALYVESLAIVTSGGYRTEACVKFEFNSLILARMLAHRMRSTVGAHFSGIQQRICALRAAISSTTSIRGPRSQEMCNLVRLITVDPAFVDSHRLFQDLWDHSYEFTKHCGLIDAVCGIRAREVIIDAILEYARAVALLGYRDISTEMRRALSSRADATPDRADTPRMDALRRRLARKSAVDIVSLFRRSASIAPPSDEYLIKYIDFFRQVLDPGDYHGLVDLLSTLVGYRTEVEVGPDHHTMRVESLCRAESLRMGDIRDLITLIREEAYSCLIPGDISKYGRRILSVSALMMYYYTVGEPGLARSLLCFLQPPENFTEHGDLDVLDIVPFVAAFQVIVVWYESPKKDSVVGKDREALRSLISYMLRYVDYAAPAPMKVGVKAYDLAKASDRFKEDVRGRLEQASAQVKE